MKSISLRFPRFGFITASSSETFNKSWFRRSRNQEKTEQLLVEDFEVRFADQIGIGSGVSFASARMGFYAILKSLNLSKNDEILLTGFTCSVMANAVIRSGAKPIYVDVCAHTYGMCPIDLKSKISENTKAIVAQHTFGIPCAIVEIAQIAKFNRLLLIEDCALSLGSRTQGIKLGDYGDCSIFSFDHSKPINTFSGGLVYSKNKKLINELRSTQKLSSQMPKSYIQSLKIMYAMEQNLLKMNNYVIYLLFWRLILLLGKLKILKLFYLDQDFYPKKHNVYPYPAKLPVFCASQAMKELSSWPDTQQTRNSYIHLYKSALRPFGLSLPAIYEETDHYIVPLRIIMNVTKEEKDKFDQLFDSNWYWFKAPIIECKGPLSAFGYESGSCPTSERLAKNIINLPCNQSPEVMRRIFNALKNER